MWQCECYKQSSQRYWNCVRYEVDFRGQHIIPCFEDACFKAPSEPYFIDLSSFIHQESNWKFFTTSFLNLPDTVFSSLYNNKLHFFPPMTGVVARPALTKNENYCPCCCFVRSGKVEIPSRSLIINVLIELAHHCKWETSCHVIGPLVETHV